MAVNINSLSPEKVPQALIACFKAGLVPFVQGSPGTGKSSIVKELAKKYNLELIDLRLSTLEPTDLTGFPQFKNGKASFVPFDFFPLETSEIPEGKNGWILFLDEFNSASRAVQAAAYKLVLDREVGMHKLHPNCAVFAAGNKMTDNAIVNRLSTAMLSRVVHINLEVNPKTWVQNIATKLGYDERILAYLAMNEDKVMNFDPERDDQTFACPRTWGFVDSLLKVMDTEEIPDEYVPIIGGAVTPYIASEFFTFCKIWKKLPKYEDIVRNPMGNHPDDKAISWALITHVMRKFDIKDAKAIMTWISKFDNSFKILFFRGLMNTYPDVGALRRNEDIKKALVSIQKYLME